MEWENLRSAQRRVTGPTLLLIAAGSLVHTGDYWLSNGTLSGLTLLLGLSALATIVTTAVPGLDRRWPALFAVVMGMSGATSLALSHEIVPAPLLNWSSVLSLDSPAVLYPSALLLLLATALGATTEGARNRRGLRAAALLGCLGIGAYWATPQFFYLEEVDISRQGGVPVVVDGELEQHPWRRDVFAGPPLALVPQLIHVEWTRADLAHGLNWSMTSATAAPQSLASDLSHYDALWRAQKILNAGYYYLSAAAAIACVPLALLLLLGRPARRIGIAITALLCSVTLVIPLANLGLLAALQLFHLTSRGAAAALLEELEFFTLFLAVALAAVTLARGSAPSAEQKPRAAA